MSSGRAPSGGTERVKTGVDGLDEMLRGGMLRGAVALVQGAPGTGKTTLGLQFVHYGAQHAGEPGMFITFEEFPQDLYRDALSLGWDLRRLEVEGRLRVVFTSPQVLLQELETPDSGLATEMRELGVRRVVVDSVTHFQEVTRDPIELRRLYRRLVGAFKREGITAIFANEDYRLFGHQEEEPHGLSFLVDGIVLLRYVEIESGVRRAILVLKMRGSDHDKDIRQFELTTHGLKIASAFQGREALLSGSPRRTLSQKAVELFG